MKPIILLAVVAVGGSLIGTGFLAGTNEFQIWIQDLGFAEGVIESPLDHANIDFEITKTLVDPDETPNTGDEFFKNDITACSFHTFEAVDTGADLICKLFSWAPNSEERVVVCEGRIIVGVNTPDPYIPSTTFLIPITQEAYEGACDVQNIDFVKIVATGEKPMSIAECPDGTTEVVIVDDGMITPADGECPDTGSCGDGVLNEPQEECDDTNFDNIRCDEKCETVPI